LKLTWEHEKSERQSVSGAGVKDAAVGVGVLVGGNWRRWMEKPCYRQACGSAWALELGLFWGSTTLWPARPRPACSRMAAPSPQWRV
jgi:hypothetical protein